MECCSSLVYEEQTFRVHSSVAISVILKHNFTPLPLLSGRDRVESHRQAFWRPVLPLQLLKSHIFWWSLLCRFHIEVALRHDEALQGSYAMVRSSGRYWRFEDCSSPPFAKHATSSRADL